MSLIGGSSDADFNFDGIGEFNFDDLLGNVPTDGKSSTEIKLGGFKKTEVFAQISDLIGGDSDHADFYDARTFAKIENENLPKGEKVLAGLLLEKEGHKPVLMTRAGEAHELEQRAIRIHQEATDGSQVVRTFDEREITIGSLTDEQYARIHSSAMANLTFIAKQQREIDSEEKTGIKLKDLASRRHITKYEGEQGVTANKLFQQQAQSFSKNRAAINRKMEFMLAEERISEERREESIEAKKDRKEEMVDLQESKRQVVVDERKSSDR